MYQNKAIYHAAIYLRISRDDGDKAESDSIQNQRALLKNYVENDPELELTREFVDDGYSGTNYDRPGFNEMIDQAQSGLIDCIIVKDLSRLGRNYIETGRYIDQIFPLLKIRFISVNDNYDSFSDHNDADQIIVPFKNLINDAYCRDISMKIRSQLEVKRKNGQFVGAFATYGYRKDPNDKTHLLIDETAADIVRLIFNMKLSGYSQSRIAQKLNEMGVLTPQEYKQSIGLKSHSGYWKGENPHWVAPTVTRILKNEVYIGNMVQGKSRKVNYKVNKVRPVDEKEWVRVEGTHEPIVSRAVFERIQELIELDTRTSPNKETVGPLSGLVRCSDCGENMTLTVKHKDGRVYHYFACSTAKAGGDCTYHSINAEKLESVVLRALQKQVQLLLTVDELLAKAEGLPLLSHRERLLDNQVKTTDKEIAHFQRMLHRLECDFDDGIVDQSDYAELKEKFDTRLHRSQEIRESLSQQKEAIGDEPILPPDWIDEIRRYGKISHLTRRMVVMLIDKIIVFNEKKVEIVFRYDDEIQELAKFFKKGMQVTERQAVV